MAITQENGLLIRQQGRQIERMYDTLIGNGDQGSVVARQLLVEERQKAAAADRLALSNRVATLQACIDIIEKQTVDDHNRIERIERTQTDMVGTQAKMAESLEKVVQTLDSWKHRGIGFAAGVSAATSGTVILVAKFLDGLLS